MKAWQKEQKEDSMFQAAKFPLANIRHERLVIADHRDIFAKTA